MGRFAHFKELFLQNSNLVLTCLCGNPVDDSAATAATSKSSESVVVLDCLRLRMASDVLCILEQFKRAKRENEKRLDQIRDKKIKLAQMEDEVRKTRERAEAAQEKKEAMEREREVEEAEAEVMEERQKAVEEETERLRGQTERTKEEAEARRKEIIASATRAAEEMGATAEGLLPERMRSTVEEMFQTQRAEVRRLQAEAKQTEGKLERLKLSSAERDRWRAMLDGLEEANAEAREAAEGRRELGAALRRKEERLGAERSRKESGEDGGHREEMRAMQERIRMLRRMQAEDKGRGGGMQ